jgi:uncharacterized protein
MPATYTSPVTPDLVTFLRSHFVLDWHGMHGANHWARVKLNGLLLAAETGADAHVVELFAFLHDSCREDDGRDYTHGSRSAALVGVLRDEKLIRVSDTQHEWLVDACHRHSDGELAAPLAVQVCWDADRLDLGRVGIRPAAHRLCTEAARQPEVIRAAYARSVGRKA